jgi:hypothetical protein
VIRLVVVVESSQQQHRHPADASRSAFQPTAAALRKTFMTRTHPNHPKQLAASCCMKSTVKRTVYASRMLVGDHLLRMPAADTGQTTAACADMLLLKLPLLLQLHRLVYTWHYQQQLLLLWLLQSKTAVSSGLLASGHQALPYLDVCLCLKVHDIRHAAATALLHTHTQQQAVAASLLLQLAQV